VAREYVKDELESVRGIVLFGSVARGEADRQSDIDLWILVEGEHMAQRNTATKVAASLSDLPIPETMPLSAVRDGDFETFWPEFRSKLDSGDWDRPDTHRHEFEFVVETPRSILGQSDRVDPVALFGEGITIFSTEDLDTIKTKLLADE
jgi:predicted nucleotidyltransferase